MTDQVLDRMAAGELRQLLDRFGSGTPRSTAVRSEIRASWTRSARFGLRNRTVKAPYNADVDADGLLRRSAADSMARTSAELGDLPATLLLADAGGRVVDRWTGSASIARMMDRMDVVPGLCCLEHEVGTNAIGSALFGRGSSIVRGPEHYAEGLVKLACAARTVRDPLTGRVLGVINILSLQRVYSPVMPALIGRLVYETEARLLGDSAAGRRRLAGEPAPPPPAPVAQAEPEPSWARLTAAERTVAQHVAQGLTNRETASLLNLSPHTIDYHLRQIFQKLQLRSRVELARLLADAPLTDR
jgi:transcriptional regulator of acetoin/glycerol metabolism